MLDKIKIFALGGLDENGKNLYVVEINNDIFVLDVGIKYPEKGMHGIDVIMPDYTYLKENKKRIKAYIITHGHDDNMGALAFLLKDAPAPVYCSYTTSIMIKYSLEKMNKNINVNFNIVETTSSHIIANRKVNFFSTTHSISQSMGAAISTSQGYIVYATDFIIDSGAFKHFKTDLNAIAKIAESKVLCLLAESSGAESPGFTSPNHKITPLIREQFQENEERIIIALHTQNIFCLKEVIDLSVENDKKIVFFSSDLENIVFELDKKNILNLPAKNRGSIIDLSKKSQKDIVVIVSGDGEALYRNIQSIVNNETMENKNMVFREEDLVILAAKSASGTESLAVETLDDLYRSDSQILNISNKIESMHAKKEDLKTLIGLLNPMFYIPINGRYKEMIANAKIASNMDIGLNHKNIFVFDNGMVANFQNQKSIPGDIPIISGELMVDGLGIFDVGSVVINDRNKLSEDGVVILGATIDSKSKKVIAGPDVQTRGLVFVKKSDDLLTELAELYVKIIEDTHNNKNIDFNEKRQIVREKVLRHVKQKTGKYPMILSMIVEV